MAEPSVNAPFLFVVPCETFCNVRVDAVVRTDAVATAEGDVRPRPFDVRFRRLHGATTLSLIHI